MPSLRYLRSFRIQGIAMFDLIAAALGTIILFVVAQRYYFPDLPARNFVLAALVLCVPVGVAAHILTGTDTTLNYHLGLSKRPV